MMSLGSSGGIGGPSSSSSSNLSASAPPFTIDRFSSNPNSNSLVHYADATPFAHTWPYSPIPSAPQPEVEPDSTLKTSVPVSSGFGYVSNASSIRWPAINPGDTSSNSGFYVPETRPYQPPFLSHVTPEDSSSLTLGQPVYDPSLGHVSSQMDHNAQMSGVGYMPQWQGVWKGESRHSDQIGSGGNSAAEKLNESSAFVYNNYVNEGPTIQSEDASGGDTSILYGLSTDGIQMASHAGSYDAGSLDKSLFTKKHNAGIYANPIDGTKKDGCSKAFNTMNVHGRSTSLNMMNVGESLFSQNLLHLPLESPGMQFQGSNSSYIEFSPRGIFQEPSKCFSNTQQTYGLQELCIPPRGSFVKDPTIPMKPACTVVIKAPASNTSSAALDTDKIVGNRIAGNGGSKLLEIPHLSEENGNFISTRPESTAGSCYTNQTENDGNYWNFFASNSEGAVPPNSQLEGSMDFILSNRPASQITNTNVSYGFSPSFDYVQGSKYAEDSLENNILALDSPCWKGAQDPYSSNNNFIESLPGIQFLRELDQCLDIPSNPEGPSRVATHELSNVNVNFRTGCPANDELPAQTITSHSSCAAKELNPNAAAKEVINCRNPHCSEDGQFLNDSDKPREENKLSDNFLGTEARYSCPNLCKMDSGFVPVGVDLHSGIEDRVTNCSEAADASAVAYHAAENVLYSPPTQEVCEEHHQTSVEVATNRVDVSALINAMHSLSEVLHSNCSDDSCELTIENQVSLKHVIRNLDACVSKKIIESTPVSELMVPQQSKKIIESTPVSELMVPQQSKKFIESTPISELMVPQQSKKIIESTPVSEFMVPQQSKKIIESTPVSEFMVPQQSTSISTGDGGHHVEANCADQPHQKCQATVTPDELGSQNIHNQKINYCEYGSQARSLPYFFPTENNKRISSDEMMVQAIKKVLDENFNFEEEMQSQVLLFKNLWLEAEARLCSISYRAHFNHMRALMDGHKLNNGKGKMPASKDSPRAKDTSLTSLLTENGTLVENLITKQSSSSIDSIADNVNTSLLPRLNASSCHGDGFSPDEQHQPGISRKNEARFRSVIPPDVVGDVEDLGAAVFARLSILKQRDVTLNEVQQQPNVLNTNNSGRQSGSSISTSNSEIHADHAEAAVLGRLNILKQRDDKPNEVQQQYYSNSSEIQVNHHEAEALARLNILKQHDNRSTAEELHNVDYRKAEGQLDSSTCGYGYESVEDFSQGAVHDQVIQRGMNSNQGISSGSHDSSSSEWEHVQKDDFLLQKG